VVNCSSAPGEGYSLCFSGGADGIYGNFDFAFLRHVGVDTLYQPSGIPLTVLIAYQMMFAIITPALITGAFTNRVTFKSYMLFLVVWQLAVYYPFVHMFWGGGLLAHWGARDFAGGIVVHASAGWAALASVLYVGKRKFADAPHNIPFIALGTGLLWFGWYGFNAGSELKVDGTAGVGCSLYAFGFTYVMLHVLNLITPVRVGAEAEEGLDASMHGESAYVLGV
jgi:Amt family ammonium transporter